MPSSKFKKGKKTQRRGDAKTQRDFLDSDLENFIFSIFLINFNHLSHDLHKNSAS
jgi:hypothetical protein